MGGSAHALQGCNACEHEARRFAVPQTACMGTCLPVHLSTHATPHPWLPPPPLHAVVASEKGVVVGRLSFREDGDAIDCTRMGVGGKAIPPNIDKVPRSGREGGRAALARLQQPWLLLCASGLPCMHVVMHACGWACPPLASRLVVAPPRRGRTCEPRCRGYRGTASHPTCDMLPPVPPGGGPRVLTRMCVKGGWVYLTSHAACNGVRGIPAPHHAHAWGSSGGTKGELSVPVCSACCLQGVGGGMHTRPAHALAPPLPSCHGPRCSSWPLLHLRLSTRLSPGALARSRSHAGD